MGRCDMEEPALAAKCMLHDKMEGEEKDQWAAIERRVRSSVFWPIIIGITTIALGVSSVLWVAQQHMVSELRELDSRSITVSHTINMRLQTVATRQAMILDKLDKLNGEGEHRPQ